MRLQSLVSRMMCGVGLVLALTSVAEAQASRTWVSGVGDDVNPCSRTAPCKTFAGAISKTATGGYINALDPAGFGALTITKAITVDGGPGHSGVSAAGVTGFIVNAAGARVVIKDVEVEGINSLTSNHGINVIAVASLHVENVHILNMGGNGINFNPSGANSELFVVNSSIRNSFSASVGNAVLVQNGRANIVNSRLDNNTRGVLASANGIVNVFNTHITGNNEGLSTLSASGVINADATTISNNQFGVVAGSGGTIRLSNCGVLSNSNTGLFNDGSSTITSLSGNSVAGNVANGSFTGPAIPKS